METFFFTIAGGVCLAVIAFPFGYGLKAPQHFDEVDRLYSRAIITTVIAISIGYIGYLTGSDMTLHQLVALNLLSEQNAERFRDLPSTFTFWFLGVTLLFLVYLFSLEVFRKTVIRPLLDERRDRSR